MRWDPEQYARYGGERARPFVDLLARVTARAPAYVVDLGCGSGELTASLLERWPDAVVDGLDASTDMVQAAQRLAVPGRLAFGSGDLRDWQPPRPVDVLVCNAVLQWVPDHLALLPRLVGALAPGGELAVQVPGNFAAPSHTLLAELRESPAWRDRVGAGARRDAAVAEPGDYLDRLAGLGCRVDAWETTYLHVLPGPDAVLEWGKGTALRPVLSQLAGDERAQFLAEYGALLRSAYPPGPYGTVLPFRRIFAVAQAGD